MGVLFPKLQLEVDRMVVLHSLVKLFDPHPKGVTIRQYGTTNRVLCVLAVILNMVCTLTESKVSFQKLL